jgi:hypothetical protein
MFVSIDAATKGSDLLAFHWKASIPQESKWRAHWDSKLVLGLLAMLCIRFASITREMHPF